MKMLQSQNYASLKDASVGEALQSFGGAGGRPGFFLG